MFFFKNIKTNKMITDLLEQHKKLTASNIYGLVFQRTAWNRDPRPFTNVENTRFYLNDLCRGDDSLLKRRGRFYYLNKERKVNTENDIPSF